MSVAAQDLEVRELHAPVHYPEGPCPWRGGLLFVEFSRDAVVFLREGLARDLWSEPGCGPSAVQAAPDGTLWVCAYEARALVQLDADGRELTRHLADSEGRPLPGPNDLAIAADGTIFFTVSGEFEPEAPVEGAVCRLRPGGVPERVARGLHYANGIALGPDALYATEHFRDRVLRFPLGPAGQVGPGAVHADLSRLAGPRPPLRGPDGIALGPEGELYAAHFACGQLARFDPRGEPLEPIALPLHFPTNVALLPEGGLVVTAFAADVAPHRGALLRIGPS